jgi:hypothetical protein
MRSSLACVLLTLTASWAWAGPGIRWSLEIEPGVAHAKKTKQPIMFYVKGSSGGDDDIEDYERDHKHAFSDPVVYALSKNFVCLQLSRSRYRKQLEDWQISPRTNLDIVFAEPGGAKLDQISASAVSSPSTLAEKMRQIRRRWVDQLFNAEVRPVFEKAEPTAKELQDALGIVIEFGMTAADQSVIKLLAANPDKRTIMKCLDALAATSSKEAVEALVERAGAGDKLADKALSQCTPAAVEYLLPQIGGDDAAAHLIAYRAVAKICKIERAKPDRFWSGPNLAARNEEIERTRELAERYAERWKAKQP